MTEENLTSPTAHNIIVFVNKADNTVFYVLNPEDKFKDILKNIDSYIIVDSSNLSGSQDLPDVSWKYDGQGYIMPEGWSNVKEGQNPGVINPPGVPVV
jgi:hypothetical protein